MKNVLKERLQKGQKVLGTMFKAGSNTAVECFGYAGLDFFVIDTEHGPFDVESALDFIRTAELSDTTPLVRVKDSTRASVLKMLDVGARGIIIPNINSIEEVEKIVEYGKYYPLGQRGFATNRAGGFGFADFACETENYLATANRQTMLIPQCETLGCLENIEKITNIEGVDGIFVGPYDLSVALGKPAQVNSQEVSGAIERILKACKTAGKFAFIFAGSKEVARKYFAAGYDAVAYSTDAIIYIEAYKQIIAEIKG